MAISTNTNQAQSQAQGQASAGYSIGGAPTGDFFSTIAGLGGGLVAQGIGGEYFNAIRERLAKVSEDLLRGVKVTLIPFSRQEYEQLHFSCIALAFQLESDTDATVAYHTLILEATGEELRPEVRLIENQQVRVNLVAGDANDGELRHLVASEVSALFPNSRIYNAATTVVPLTIDARSDDAVSPIFRNAAVAATSAILTVLGKAPTVDLSTIGRETRLSLDMTTGHGCTYDVVGNPQRADINVAVSAQKKNGRTNNTPVINKVADTIKVCEVTGFVNPIWVGQAGADYSGFGFMNQAQSNVPTGKLMAEFVVTGVHTPYAQSASAVALAISSVLLVADNNNWVQALLPRAFGARNEMSDLGALNRICNIGNETANGIWGSVIDTAEMGNDLMKFNQFIGKLFRPGTVISIDCPEASPQSWYLNQYAAAAMGDAQAIEAVKAAFDELTAGNFTKFFNPADSLFVSAQRIATGYYVTGTDKRKSDIRDVDLTMVANAFKNNPDNITEYLDTFVPRQNSGPEINRIKREGIIGHILKEQYKITGYALRCTFSASAIQALSQAMAALYLNTVVNTPLSVDQLRTGTPAPAHIHSALAQVGQTYVNSGNMVSRGGGMPYNYQQFLNR